MIVKGKISPRLIMSMASLYVEPIRVFMEFIDNSIDAAEFDNMKTELSGEHSSTDPRYLIDFRVSSGWYKSGHVEISDNCSGIRDLRSIVENIGNSEKKSQAWLNGQFGYGLYSFLAVCDYLEITTKHKDNPYSEYVKIGRKEFLVDDLSELAFEIAQKPTHTPVSGTRVMLSGFAKEYWRNLDYMALKNEIGKHFELLLQNNDIKIRVTGPDGVKRECLPFDYDTYEGVVFDKTVSIDVKSDKKSDKSGNREIRVYLKYMPKISLDRQPVVISKKRRVTELWPVKSFKSNHRRDIWNHPSITGYIDTNDLLSPTIARNDFKNDKNFKLICKAILLLEDEIIETFKAATESEVERDFSDIESGFNSKFDGIFESESDEKREPKPGDKVIIAKEGTTVYNILIPDSKGPGFTEFRTGKESGLGKGRSGYNKNRENTNILNSVLDKAPIEPQTENKSKLKLKIDDNSEPIKDSEGKEKRSELFGDTVTVYKKHPDFKNRVKTDSLGGEYITTELISYIATQLLIHYTDFKFNISAEKEERGKRHLLLFFTDNLYRLEDSLKSFINKPLSK